MFFVNENNSEQISLYKQSYYNFELKLDNGKYILYNTKTGAVSLLDSNERNTMRSDFSGKTECKNRLLMDNLLSQGFIVEKNRNELDDIKSITQSFRKAKNLVRLIVLPAEACNFTCPYCFIYRQRNLFMSEWVYDAILKYIENMVSKSTDQTLVQLSWYGGEPLLASQRIIEFMGRLNRLKEKYNFKINSSIYTNGYLLTRDLFQKLLECGIETFQVTVDGGKNSHDRLRKLTSGEPTFDAIYTNLKNIKKFAAKEKSFKFYIRANFLKSSIESMNEFLEDFVEDFGTDNRFSIFFRPVYHFTTSRNDVEKVADDILDPDEGVNSQLVFANKVFSQLPEKSMDSMVNIFKPLPSPMHTWCTGSSGNTYIIGADGAIFMCDTMMVEKEKSVGEITLDGRISLNENAQPWIRPVFEDLENNRKECLECKLLPVCLGGCRLSAASGHKACFWSEKVILDSMRKYAQMISG